jgi:hypothetical protein
MILKPPKSKPCKVCKVPFVPRSSTQQVCSPQCAHSYAEVTRERKEAKEARIALKLGREKLKTHGDYVAEAQDAVNKWIKLRDRDQPCISCGQYRKAYDAGHYLARSIRPELRFHEDNIHKQCVYCNNYNKGRAAGGYRTGLILRIGHERVLALEAPHPPAKWTVDDLKQIRQTYKLKLKQLRVSQ